MDLFHTVAQNRKKITILVAIIFLFVVSIYGVVTVVKKPGTEDFKTAQTAVTEITKTQEVLPATVNAYFASYTREFNATGSIEKAKVNAAKEYDAFVKAETSATDAIKRLNDTKASNDAEIEQAIAQYIEVTTDRTNYYSGMVASYAGFKGLFASSDGADCSGIFIGSTTNLTDRKDRLKTAAAGCYPAINELKKSKNSSYVDYAFQMERRVKLLEQDAATIAKSEQLNNEYSKQLPVFEQKAADARARNAPEQEVSKLADEIKAYNVKIKDNQADFDYSSKRYLATVKEFPTLTEAVFTTSIPAKLKTFTSLHDVRLATLNLVLDDKLID